MINKNLNEKTIKNTAFGTLVYKYEGLDAHCVFVAYNRAQDRMRYEKYIVTYYKNNKIYLTRKIGSLKEIKEFISAVDGFAF